MQNTAKQFYHQTSVYLSPQPSTSTSTFSPGLTVPFTHPVTNSTSSASSSSSHPPVSNPRPLVFGSEASDKAHVSRLAQFDLARYNHHSTLLFAVPPSSIGCIDLLVALYGWAGGLLGGTPAQCGDITASIAFTPSCSSQYLELAPLKPPESSTSRTAGLKSSLTDSLTRLAQIRSHLLHAWTLRNRQTTMLEDEASRIQADLDGHTLDSPAERSNWMYTGISSSGVEHKPAKNHKNHRSVGGRLRDLLSSSGSSTSLAAIDNTDRSARMSLDVACGRRDSVVARTPRSIPEQTLSEEDDVDTTTAPTSPTDNEPASQSFPFPSSTPFVPAKNTSAPPSLPSRHSVHVPQAPFLPLAVDASSDLRSAPARFGGVGGLDGTGDEDAKREEVGRRREGVLWGAGTWEGMTKPGGKGKWESTSLLARQRYTAHELP